MVIIGSKGFAKEVLEILHQLNYQNEIAFFDDISEDTSTLLFNKFKIIKHLEALGEHFEKTQNREYTLGLGNPRIRYEMSKKIESIKGELRGTISPYAKIGHYNTTLGEGINLMTGTVITNDVLVKKGALINLNCTIGHDCIIGEFVELSPGVHVSGNCMIGDFTDIGTNATILPKIKIGVNVTVGAGSVVTKDVEDNSVVVGVPAKVIKIKDNFKK